MHRSRHLNKLSNLSRLIAISAGRPVNWLDADLADILDHELSSSLLYVLKPPAELILSLGSEAAKVGAGNLATLGDLLRHPAPPISLLRLANDVANTADTREDDPLPARIGTALYFLTIAAAIVRYGKNISSMDETGVRTGLKWVSDQNWIAGSLRELAAAAYRASRIDRAEHRE